jgi:hypothetical protein
MADVTVTGGTTDLTVISSDSENLELSVVVDAGAVNVALSQVQGVVGAALRVSTVASANSISVDVGSFDVVEQLNTEVAGTLTINNPTGTPSNFRRLLYRIKSTNVQTLSWGANFDGSDDFVLTTATSGSDKWDYFGFVYNESAAKWQFVAKVLGF